MNVDGAITVARLIQEVDGVVGRKRLQKIVHLLREAGNDEFKQKFILHYFGPFSRQLAAQLDYLDDVGLVTESRHTDGAYSYKIPAADGAKYLDSLCPVGNEPPRWSQLANELNDMDLPLLESVSTVVFLCSGGVSESELQKKFKLVKPHLASFYADARKRAVQFLSTPSTRRCKTAL